MRFVTVRDLRNSPGKVQEMLREGDLVLTASGKPVAVIIPAGQDLEGLILELRRTRAQLALSRIRKDAAAAGADLLTNKQIDEEIAEVRSHRNNPRTPLKKARKTA